MTYAVEDHEHIRRRAEEIRAEKNLALTGSTIIQHDAATGETLEYTGYYDLGSSAAGRLTCSTGSGGGSGGGSSGTPAEAANSYAGLYNQNILAAGNAELARVTGGWFNLNLPDMRGRVKST